MEQEKLEKIVQKWTETAKKQGLSQDEVVEAMGYCIGYLWGDSVPESELSANVNRLMSNIALIYNKKREAALAHLQPLLNQVAD